MIKKILLLCTLCGVFALPLSAYDYLFKHLDTKDGLSNRQVNAILKDSQGFMWFGTASGLDRFDGYHFRKFYMSPTDMKTLPDNYIETIQEASGGELWIRTGGGYVIYDSQKESFDRDVRQRVWNCGLEQIPSLIFIDRNKDFWFYVEGKGCYWYKNDQKLLYPFLQEGGNLPEGKVVSIVNSNEGALLVYADGRLVCLSGKQRRSAWQSDYIPQTYNNLSEQFSAFVDRKENVWVYGPSWLWIYNRQQGKWATSISSLAEQWGIAGIPNLQGAVKSITQDKQGRIWLGTEREGLIVIDSEAKKIKHLVVNEENERTLRNNNILFLYTDDKDIVWVGTQRKGVSYYNKSIYKFNLDYVGEVTSVSEDTTRDCLWLGTNGAGLLMQDRATGTVKNYTNAAGNSISGDVVNTTLVTKSGKVYIATYRGGLDSFDGSKFTHYHFADSIQGTISSLAEDPDGNIWIGFMGSGLRCYNPQTGSLMSITAARNKLVSDYVTDLAIGTERNLLVGTVNGLSVITLSTRNVQSYMGCKAGNQPFSNTYMNQVCQDEKGHIWLATRNGLNIYNPSRDNLLILDEKDGLSDAVILGITEDREHNMWVATSSGLSNVVVKNNSNGASSYQIYNYDELDGLQGYELNPRAICTTSSGEIVIGGLKGINRFMPDQIVFDKALPHVVFTSLLIDDEPVVIDKMYNGKVILDRAVGKTQRIVLDASQNRFEIQVVTDSHNLPGKMKLQYMLDGYDKDWLIGKNGEHSISYSNLPSGNYTLRVKAINSDGYASDEETTLEIVVTPPFWRTWWAYIIYLLVLLVVLDLGRRWVIRKERTRMMVKIKELEKLAERGRQASEESEEADSVKEEAEAVDAEQSAEQTSAEKQAAVLPPKEKPLILLVDDKEDFRLFMSEQLQHIYRVETSASAQEVWELLETCKPDIILCDMEMPEMDGNELCNLVKANGPTENIPFIMMTDESMKEERSQNLLFGADDYLAKPFNIKLLVERINKLLKWKHSEDAAIFEYKNPDMILADATISEEDNERFQSAIRYVEDNLSRLDLSVSDMSTSLGIDRSKLYKIIQTVSGKTPVEFIREMRLKRAAQLLLESDMDADTVASTVGFGNIKAFYKYFEDEFGVEPSSYKKK